MSRRASFQSLSAFLQQSRPLLAHACQLERCRSCPGIGLTVATNIQMTKRILRNFVAASVLVGVALGTIACPEKGPAEKAGEKIDDAVDKAKEAVK